MFAVWAYLGTEGRGSPETVPQLQTDAMGYARKMAGSKLYDPAVSKTQENWQVEVAPSIPGRADPWQSAENSANSE
jgi:hypothetical protein